MSRGCRGEDVEKRKPHLMIGVFLVLQMVVALHGEAVDLELGMTLQSFHRGARVEEVCCFP